MRLLLAGEDRFGQGPFLSIDEDAYEVVAFANTADDAVELADSLRPDAVLLEAGMSNIARNLSGFASVVILSQRPAVADAGLVGMPGLVKAALALATASPSA